MVVDIDSFRVDIPDSIHCNNATRLIVDKRRSPSHREVQRERDSSYRE